MELEELVVVVVVGILDEKENGSAALAMEGDPF